MLAQGHGGELRAGARLAAEIDGWRLEPGLGDEHVVHAALRVVDAFWMTQPPLSLTLNIGPARWRWREVVVAGGQMRVNDPPEVL